VAGSVSGIDKGTKAPRILSDAWENGCQRGRMDMSKYSRGDIIRMVEDEDVEFIRLQFTDIFGILKNVAITASQLNKALNNDCMFDGSAIEGFVRIDESDMYLHPDLDTFEIFPWRPQQGKVARLICDVYNPDGTPFIGDPRYVLKRAVKRAADMGYTFQVGPECEFFLFHTDEEGRPTTQSHERASYFDVSPIDLGENVRRDIVLNLEDMGFVQVQLTEGDRKQFYITDVGQAHLKEQQTVIQQLLEKLETKRDIQSKDELMDIHRAMENLKTSLRLKLNAKSVDAETVRQIAAQIDAAAVAISRL
jgi:hypothetical protein